MDIKSVNKELEVDLNSKDIDHIIFELIERNEFSCSGNYCYCNSVIPYNNQW